MMKRFGSALLALGVALLSTQAMAEEPHPCQAKLEYRLEEYGLTMGDIKHFYWTAYSSGRHGEGPVASYQATLVPKQNCPHGDLVMMLTTGCYIQDVYTQDTCHVNGVPNYSLF